MTTAKKPKPVDVTDAPAVRDATERLHDAEHRLAELDGEIGRRQGASSPSLDESATAWLDGETSVVRDHRDRELRRLHRDRRVARRAVEIAARRVREAKRTAAHEALAEREDEYRAIAEAVTKHAGALLTAIERELAWREAVLDSAPEMGQPFELLPSLEARRENLRYLIEKATEAGYH